MTRAIRTRQLLRTGYVKKRNGDLALALSAMKVWEARGLVVQSRALLDQVAKRATGRR